MRGKRVLGQLPFALLATAAVVVAPAVAVAALPGRTSPLVGIPACIVLSLAITRVCALLWRRSKRSREVLFADLMLWGWVRRVLTERRLANAESLFTEAAPGSEQRLKALERVSDMLEARDAYTRHHSLRVTRHSEAIARGLGLPDAEVARVRQAAALHDVGKFFTPRSILNKPGRLTDEEFEVVKLHPGQGADLLHGVVEPEVEAMIRHHHERLGGAGYPDGLTGDAIPLGARIIAVADTFDAMTSTRAYRSARPHAQALRVLREEAGVALDAQAVAAFEAYYGGRRGITWSSIASGMTQTLAPLRELILPAARALPALGAATVLTAPVVAGETATARPAPKNVTIADTTGPIPDAAARDSLALDKVRLRKVDLEVASVRARSDHRSGFEGRRQQTNTPVASAPVPGSGSGERQPTVAPPTAAPEATPAPGAAKDPAEAPAPVSTPAPAPSQPAAPAPASEPEITTPSVTVEDTEIVPEIPVDVPDLPVEVPQVELPSIKLP